MVEDAIDRFKDALEVTESEYLPLAATASNTQEIWSVINQRPVRQNANRLIVVRDCDRMTSWRPFRGWMDEARNMPGVFVVFVSDKHDLPYRLLDSEGSDKPKKVLPDHVHLIQSRGKAVKCSPMSKNDLIAFAQHRIAASELTCDYLVERTGLSVAALHNALLKLELFSGTVTPDVIDLFCAENLSDAWTSLLLRDRKKEAFTAALSISPNDYGRLIGRLAGALVHLEKLNWAARNRMSTAELMRTGEVPAVVVKDLFPLARNYDEIKRTRCYYALAVADEALSLGERSGILESLITAW